MTPESFDIQLSLRDILSRTETPSPTLESFIERQGYDLSEEGLTDAFRRVIRRIQLRVNDAYAGITYLKDQQLRDLAQAHEEGANSTITLPVSKVKSIIAILGTMAFYTGLQQKGQDRARSAYDKAGHARQTDKLVQQIAGLPKKQAIDKLVALANQSAANLKKMQHELSTNKNLTPDEVRYMSHAVEKAAALAHRR